MLCYSSSRFPIHESRNLRFLQDCLDIACMLSTSTPRRVRSGTHAVFGDDRCRAQSVAVMEQVLHVCWSQERQHQDNPEHTVAVTLSCQWSLHRYNYHDVVCRAVEVVVDDDYHGAADDVADDTNPGCW